MRYLLVASALLLGSVTSAHAQVSVSIGIPAAEIGVEVGAYPELVRVPGYPVYYAPRASANYFFYDGAYWVYAGDNWYASSWYNGPWQLVAPEAVPLYVLRVPVRYYRRPPPYFRGWRAEAPPRWGDHWGRDWERHREGWDRWDRRAVPRAAPLPVYQRGYGGDRYPAPEHQHAIRSEQYRYQPREEVTRQHFSPPASRGNPGGWRAEPERRGPPPQALPAAQPRHDDGRQRDDGRRNDHDPHGRGGEHEDEGRGHRR
jgi:hypothetical protein